MIYALNLSWAKLVSGHFEHPLFESLYQQRA